MLEKGHTQMEADSVHSVIERKLKGKTIYCQSAYATFIREACLDLLSYNCQLYSILKMFIVTNKRIVPFFLLRLPFWVFYFKLHNIFFLFSTTVVLKESLYSRIKKNNKKNLTIFSHLSKMNVLHSYFKLFVLTLFLKKKKK